MQNEEVYQYDISFLRDDAGALEWSYSFAIDGNKMARDGELVKKFAWAGGGSKAVTFRLEQ